MTDEKRKCKTDCPICGNAISRYSDVHAVCLFKLNRRVEKLEAENKLLNHKFGKIIEDLEYPDDYFKEKP